MTTTKTKTTARSRKPAAAAEPPTRIGRPTLFEGEKEKKLISLTKDAISIVDQLLEAEGCTFSNAIEKSIRAMGQARGIRPIATVRI